MTSVDRVARQLLDQGQRIEALERARSLANSSLVNATIAVLEADDDGNMEEIGQLGRPVFDALNGLGDTLTAEKAKVEEALTKLAADLEAASRKAQKVSEGLEGAQQDADKAAEAAAEALAQVQGAVAAAAAAEALAATLDGKLVISEQEPTPADAEGKQDGSIWEVRDGGTLTKRFILVDGGWVQHKIGSEIVGENTIGTPQIAELDVSKLSTGIGQMAVAVIETIIADAAHLGVLQAHKIVIAGDPTNKIGATLIEDGAITAPKIQATTELWTKILAVAGDATIGGNLVTDGTISASKLVIDEALARTISALVATFQEAFIGKLSAQMIAADTFTGYEISGAKLVSPSATGNITIADNTMSVNRYDTDSVLQTTMRIGGADTDEISLFGEDQRFPSVTITGDGNAAFSGQTSVGSLLVGGENIEDMIRRQPRGIIASTSSKRDIGWRDSSSPHLLTRFTDLTLEAGRLYRADFSGALKADSYPQAARFNLYWKPGGHLVSAANGFLIDTAYRVAAQPLTAGDWSLLFTVPATTPEGQVAVTLQSDSTKANVSLHVNSAAPWLVTITDVGPAELQAGETFRITTGSTSDGATAGVSRKTTTWTAAAVKSWRGTGTVTGELGHGYYGGYQRYSQILFPNTMRTQLAGAKIVNARVRLRNLHTYAGSGMTATLTASPLTSLSNTVPTGSAGTTARWAKGATQWVSLPGFTTGTQSVILGLGAGTSGAYYGKFSAALTDCALEVTYEK